MCPPRRLNNVDNISVYCDLALGIQTLSMMVDLALNVKSTWMKDYPDEEMMYESQLETAQSLLKAKKINHILSFTLAGVAAVSCLIFCIPNLVGISD